MIYIEEFEIGAELLGAFRIASNVQIPKLSLESYNHLIGEGGINTLRAEDFHG